MKQVRIRPGVVLLSVCDEHLLVATREARQTVTYVRQVNSAGAFYWKLLEEGRDPGEIIQQAALRYQMTVEQATAAVMSFMRRLYQAGYLIIEDVEDAE